MNGWFRTAIMMTEREHSIRVLTKDGNGWGSERILWPENQWLTATAHRAGDRWVWHLLSGGHTIGKGDSASESGARSAVMRLVKKHRAAMRAKVRRRGARLRREAPRAAQPKRQGRGGLLMRAHPDCWFGEPCGLGKPAECPPAIAAAKREKGAPWSQLKIQREPGGLRHYLDGKPVHCGDGLELQAIGFKHDDYGEYTVALPRGFVVRYEASQDGREISAGLHADVGGHEFTSRLEEWHRFRWPR